MARHYQKEYQPAGLSAKLRKIIKQFKQQKNKFKLLVAIILVIIAAASFTLWYFWEIPLFSPLSSFTTFEFIKETIILPTKNQKVVYGFLPYWNLDKVKIQPELTHLSYFGLNIGADGKIITRGEEGLDPGYHKLNSDQLFTLASQVSHHQGKVDLVLKQFSNDDIFAFINNEEAHQRLLTSLDSILLAYPISGINIDIEYTGQITPQLRTNFVKFMQTLNKHLDQKYQGVELSIDMYAIAASKEQIWDVAAIGQEVDYIIIMAYDFHRRSSSQAGPVAPLFGGNKFWDSDINQNLKAFIDKVPKEKLLLGIPFYGYEWQTTSRQAQANTYPDTGSTASFKRVKEILQKKAKLQVQENWDDTALCPYLSYIDPEDGQTYMIYFENARSIRYKLEYVNLLDLGGVAIWALGYEGMGRELWEEIGRVK